MIAALGPPSDAAARHSRLPLCASSAYTVLDAKPPPTKTLPSANAGVSRRFPSGSSATQPLLPSSNENGALDPRWTSGTGSSRTSTVVPRSSAGPVTRSHAT